MGASINGEEEKTKKDKDEEAFNIKKKKKDRNGKSFFGCSARSRWVTERIASAWNASPGPIRNQNQRKRRFGSGL